MPESLLYELLTTTPTKRTACFRKLPDIDSPVVLVPNVGTLLQYEIINKAPCKPVTRAAIDVRYQFNKRLRSGNYILPQEQANALNEWKEEVRNDIESFKERSAVQVGALASMDKRMTFMFGKICPEGVLIGSIKP